MQLVLSINETSHVLNLGRTTIYGLIKQGRLQTVKLGTRTLVKKSSILALIGETEVAN
jgi:excisionase family DNA binding protein